MSQTRCSTALEHSKETEEDDVHCLTIVQNQQRYLS